MTHDQLRHLGRWMRNTAFTMICTLFVILMSGFDGIIELLQEWIK